MSEIINVRKTVTLVETIRHEGGTPPEKPLKKGAILIVLKNPFAGSYVEDVLPMMDALKPVGLEAAQELISLLGGPVRSKVTEKAPLSAKTVNWNTVLSGMSLAVTRCARPSEERWRLFLLPRK